MQLAHTRPVTAAVLGDPNLVSSPGLVPLVALAQAGLRALADKHLTVPTDKGANAGLKTTSVVAGMAGVTPVLAGVDEQVIVDIDDTIIEVHGHTKDGSGYGYSGVGSAGRTRSWPPRPRIGPRR